MNRLHFEQGGLGQTVRRPTSMTTNLDVVELKGIQDQRSQEEVQKGAWSMWAPMLARTLTRGLKRWKMRPGWYPRLVKALIKRWAARRGSGVCQMIMYLIVQIACSASTMRQGSLIVGVFIGIAM